MNKTTKQALAALLPLAVAGVWVPRFLPSRGDDKTADDPSGGVGVGTALIGEDPVDGTSGWIEADRGASEIAPELEGQGQAVDVLELGVAGTLERVDRLEAVLASTRLFRAPDPKRQVRIVETLEAALAVAREDPGLGLDENRDPAGQLVPVSMGADLSQGRPGELEEWVAAHPVGGILCSASGSRCLLDGRVLAVGDTIGRLGKRAVPLILVEIEQDAVIVARGSQRARVELAHFANRAAGPRAPIQSPAAAPDDSLEHTGGAATSDPPAE